MDEADPKDNKVFVKRDKYCVESPEIVLIVRPNIDVFYIDKLISPGIDVAIKFIPNDDKFLFMSAGGDNIGQKVVIKEINLNVAAKQMFDATELPFALLSVSETCGCRTPA